ncbi:MAG: hypothetical protein PF486_05720 [Prolixibacteraceae bacterium]|jgi:hypothetical protein|nr:hypothetical protein [Prolixibacteraceae bacterium]
MKRYKKITISLVVSVILFAGCSDIGEYYVGLNMQPDMSEAPFEPGLNVFGIVKTGPSFDTANHYFEVHQLADLFNYEEENLIVVDANITLTRQTDGGEVFTYRPEQTTDSIYVDRKIEVSAGDKWFYTCSYDSFLVESECIVPAEPHINNDVKLNENNLGFTIQPDSTAFMYGIYVLENDNIAYEQILSVPGDATKIEISLGWSPEKDSGQIFVFAYDENFRTYYATSNTFFKPNAYRPAFTTVEGGYGVFGAVSSVLVSY